MSAALDRLTQGYWNMALRSGANPGGLSGIGAMRDNWPLVLADIAAVTIENAGATEQALQAAISALQAPGTFATSTTEITIPGVVGGVIPFTVQEADKLFLPGLTCLLAPPPPNALNSITGRLTAFDPVAKTASIKAEFLSGAGTFANWKLCVTAPIDNTLTGRVAALEQANAQFRSLALFHGKEFF